jgi:HK97 family phage portal protein
MTQKTGLFTSTANAIRGVWNRVTAPLRIVDRVIRGGRTPAGVWIDAESALKNATVWACVQYRSKTLAQLPWRVMREDPRLGCVPAPTHPADWLLNKRPNPEMGAFTFRQTLLAWVLLHGNGYAEIERDNRGAPYALWPLHPSRVKPFRREDGSLAYRVWNEGGGFVDLDAMDVFHVRGLGDGIVGKSVIDYAAESIGWARATEIFGSTFFGEGMNPSGVVETPKPLSGPAMAVLREELKRLYAGVKGERTVILDNGMKFSRLAMPMDEAQFIETRQHQVDEICRWFSTPPHKAMNLLRATFTNIEHQSIEVVTDVVLPDVKLFEEEADFKLFGPQNRGGFYTKVFLQALLRGDNASRAQFYKDMVGMGVMSINEVRQLEDMNPIGAQGDVRFVPVNMMTLERAIAQGEPDPADPSEPSEDDDPADPAVGGADQEN